MDTTTKINCQVGDVFRADCVMLGPDQSRFQGRDFFRNREHRHQFVSIPKKPWGYLLPSVSLFAEPFLPVYGSRFVIDCPSHVCLYVHFRAESTSLDEALIVVASIAIWNRKKLAVGISLGVWGCNVAFLIQGGPPLFNRS